ncbi:dATP/dGTP diphosphohydrolase domain-containing protein [Flavobacterium sp.]|jgi:hypothetical protein|uniref:dATP/dGTP diphosphohydrolase domain-containing protein n=1 Tax=Flavobacterium sp. TaxID=239 RepID=UPI0037C0ED4E
MEYTYTVYEEHGEDNVSRRELTTDVHQLKPTDVLYPRYVEVCNELTKVSSTLRSLDQLEDHIIARERAAVWKPAKGNLPDSNLKTAAAVGKPGISAVPPIALLAIGAAMQDGVNKYEKYNWREAGATVSVFYDAMARHLIGYYMGENYAADSKIHHLAHLMAGCAILLDAEYHGKLNDDRLAGKLDPELIKSLMALIKKS